MNQLTEMRGEPVLTDSRYIRGFGLVLQTALDHVPSKSALESQESRAAEKGAAHLLGNPLLGGEKAEGKKKRHSDRAT